jgi:hypothetical protein
MTKAAENPGGGGGIGAGMGMGMGMAMADRMARRGPWGAAPEQPAAPAPGGTAAPPPPPPGAKSWHVAKDGQTTGPFSRDELGRMAAEGSIDPDTWLWTPGGPDWTRGRDVTELADLFSAPPPPPPGA